MPPENIDDLFREKLDGHASPPADDLWARLQAHAPADATPVPAAAPERLDQLFQKSLSQHATAPDRVLWERLEDEHLRPRKRRAAAWWPMALAAAVALLLLVGGAGLWLGGPTGRMTGGSVASQTAQPTKSSPAAPLASDAIAADKAERISEAAQPIVAAVTPAAAEKNAAAKKVIEKNISTPEQKNATIQATRFQALASTASKASKAAREQSSRHLKGTARPLDATVDQAQSVARTTTPPAARPASASVTDESRKALETALATAQTPKPTPAAGIVPATTNQLITVDVRPGDALAARPAKATTSALASADAPAERKRLGGRLLQQAGRLVRGEKVNLAEAAGLPQNLTLQATLGGRTVSKSIQL